jgi:hypothetical protein
VKVELTIDDATLDAIVERVASRLEARLGPMPTASGERPRISKSELARLLGVSPKTVDRCTEDGMPCLRVGDRPMYLRDECEAWLAARERKPAGGVPGTGPTLVRAVPQAREPDENQVVCLSRRKR